MEAQADRESLGDKSFLTDHDPEEGPEPARPDLDSLQRLVEKSNCESTPYQSVAVAAVQILEQALRHERQVAEAALSLGQQEKLTSMVQMADRAVSVLRDTLSAQGHKVMHLCARQSGAADASASATSSEPSWRPVLTSALEVLEEGTNRMVSLTTGQPSGSPARKLSRHIAQLLRSHHDVLLIEAEEWTA